MKKKIFLTAMLIERKSRNETTRTHNLIALMGDLSATCMHTMIIFIYLSDPFFSFDRQSG